MAEQLKNVYAIMVYVEQKWAPYKIYKNRKPKTWDRAMTQCRALRKRLNTRVSVQTITIAEEINGTQEEKES